MTIFEVHFELWRATIYQTHPQRHRNESHKLNLRSNALHLAHDLIHIGPPLIRTDCRSFAGLGTSREQHLCTRDAA